MHQNKSNSQKEKRRHWWQYLYNIFRTRQESFSESFGITIPASQVQAPSSQKQAERLVIYLLPTPALPAPSTPGMTTVPALPPTPEVAVVDEGSWFSHTRYVSHQALPDQSRPLVRGV